jgi:hypothetical protein
MAGQTLQAAEAFTMGQGVAAKALTINAADSTGRAVYFLSELFVEQSPALRELVFEVRMREPA